ncbi:MAG: hypothetical protein ABW148_18340 [Sedimenticola sp.]
MEDRLLAILQLPKEDRVLCQLDACNHPVYKRVHVVIINSELLVIGSECFKKHFKGEIDNEIPLYTSSQGKLLTEAERELLKINTEELIESLKNDYELEIQKIEESKKQDKERKLSDKEELNRKIEGEEQKRKNQSKGIRKIEGPIDHHKMAMARDIINKQFREERGINPDSPGFSGWAKFKAEQLYLEMIEK